MLWRTPSVDLAGGQETPRPYSEGTEQGTGLDKQGARLPDQVQGFLLLRRANLSTQARIAIVTLAGDSVSVW